MTLKIAVDDPLGRFLCCALADDPAWHQRELGQLWAAVGDDAAWAFAGEHESQGTVAIALEGTMGNAMPSRWRVARESVASRIGQYLQQVDRVAAALAVENIPLVALKNSGIARGIFTDLGGCIMGDVDLLVRPAQLGAAHRIFSQLGFRLLGNQDVGRQALGVRMAAGETSAETDSIEADILSGGREYAFDLEKAEPLWFELQCRSIGGKWIPRGAEPSVEDFVRRAVPIPGTAVRLLAPEDNLLQVCLHTAKHTYVRAPGFRLHTDVDRIVRRCSVDWAAFVNEVERLQVCTAVYLSLQIPSEHLNTPVPKAVLNRLRPVRWKEGALLLSLRGVGYFYPRRRKWTKAGYIVFNLMLYDTLGGVWHAFFPDRAWMKQRYGITSDLSLPLWYARRILDLLIKRAHT
jgi:hypothetical protein